MGRINGIQSLSKREKGKRGKGEKGKGKGIDIIKIEKMKKHNKIVFLFYT